MKVGRRLGLFLLFFGSSALAGEVDFTGQAVVYDKTSDKFTAIGGITLSEGGRDMRANAIEFDAQKNEIEVDGKIDMKTKEATITTRDLLYNTDTATGTLGEAKVELGTAAALKSDGMEVRGDDTIVMQNVEYSACKKELLDCGETPTWKIGASRVTHYQESGQLLYKNAVVYMWDVPIFWLPFFTNYGPNVKNKTGFLTPAIGMSNVLGTVYRQPAYLNINRYNDLTFTPIFTTKRGLIYEGEYRTNQDFMTARLFGNYKRGENESENARWYYNIYDYMEFDNTWRAKIDFSRTSDDTYLRLYELNTDPWLTSRAHLEGVRGKSYLTLDTYTYQDLRQVPDGFSPKVLPIVNYRRISETNSAGGQWDTNLNSARILREYTKTNTPDESYFRTSAQTKYLQPARTDGGHLFDFGLSARADVYSLSDIMQQNGEHFSGSEAIASTQASAMWRYPLVRGKEILEPTAQIIASPKANRPDSIPNMDSKYMELDSDNLFQEDRFAGYDLFESGTRANYGLRYTFGGRTSVFLGQNYNIDTPEELYLDGSGLASGDGFSDVVSDISYRPSGFLYLGYKFRMNHENFSMNRQDLRFQIGPRALNFTANYVYLRSIFTEDGDNQRKDELNTRISSQLTRTWSVFAANKYDFNANKTLQIVGGVAFENNCFRAALNLANDYMRDRDYEGNKSIYLTVTYNTLGTIGYGSSLSETNGISGVGMYK
ncbi:MAG: LPS assembly protein LptD [Rickettsiales bacterium]|jgi:LPS-assembly protein|nr:LPS assembly protein LptD [Rickettsiales bacterium]